MYLKNSELRYNKIKTLADIAEPRVLEGRNGIYVDVYVKYKDKKIYTDTVEELMKISNNIIILGSGGTGKSMLMRHLFVSTQRRGNYIPILVELRKMTNVDESDALFKMIHKSIEEFDVKLDTNQFEYSLRSGKYLLLFDGLDEVKELIRYKVEKQIQELSKKYPQNKYIVSSRKDGMDFKELETYTEVKALPLDKSQAVELVNKIGKNNNQTRVFSKLLFDELYEKYMDFASNPLLLTMMYITFIDNNIIPEQLIEFYEASYDALYKRHDANKYGVFKRNYKCKKLGKKEFKDLFSYFCFQTYFMQKYEFSKEEICEYIGKGIERLSLQEAIENPEMFFSDIKDIVCLIIKDGNRYKFTPRSFQTYFAAYYMSIQVSDKNQKKFLGDEIRNQRYISNDFFCMLYSLEGDRFNSNVLEHGIKEIVEKIEKKELSKMDILSLMYQCVLIDSGKLMFGYNSRMNLEISYERKILMIYYNIYNIKYNNRILEQKIINKLKEIGDIEYNYEIEIQSLVLLKKQNQNNNLIDLLVLYTEISKLSADLSEWIAVQENKRKQIKEESDRIKMLEML